MCEAMSLAAATLALSAGSSAASYASQSSAASQQSRFQNHRYSETAAASLAAYHRGLNQLIVRGSQETEAASRESLQVSTENQGQKARIQTITASAGLSGNSVKTLLNQFDAIEADSQYVIGKNIEMKQAQIRESMLSLRSDAQARVSGTAPQPVQTPSPFALLLNLGSSALGAVETYKRYQPPEASKVPPAFGMVSTGPRSPGSVWN